MKNQPVDELAGNRGGSRKSTITKISVKKYICSILYVVNISSISKESSASVTLTISHRMRRGHLVSTKDNGESIHEVCSHTRSPAHRNSSLRKKKKKKQGRDNEEVMKTERSTVGTKDRSSEGLSIAEGT
jgi:hypothetical protein